MEIVLQWYAMVAKEIPFPMDTIAYDFNGMPWYA
jgi:hypothetical protein